MSPTPTTIGPCLLCLQHSVVKDNAGARLPAHQMRIRVDRFRTASQAKASCRPGTMLCMHRTCNAICMSQQLYLPVLLCMTAGDHMAAMQQQEQELAARLGSLENQLQHLMQQHTALHAQHAEKQADLDRCADAGPRLAQHAIALAQVLFSVAIQFCPGSVATQVPRCRGLCCTRQCRPHPAMFMSSWYWAIDMVVSWLMDDTLVDKLLVRLCDCGVPCSCHACSDRHAVGYVHLWKGRCKWTGTDRFRPQIH